MKDGTTPLMAALQARRRVEPGLTADPIEDERIALQAITVAVDRGVDVNASNEDGTTALHIAASRRLTRIVQFLVERGAAVDARNAKGQTPLALASGGASPAAANGPNPTADLLRKLGAKE